MNGEEANTVSLRREIAVFDVNDNAPEFWGRPYSALLSEAVKPGTVVFENITVTDIDSAHNAEITLTCLGPACDKFLVTAEKVLACFYSHIDCVEMRLFNYNKLSN